MQASRILRLLPIVFQKGAEPGSPLAALLDVMHMLHAPDEEVLANLDRILDPRRTSEPFVYFLAHWADLERFFVETNRRKKRDNFHFSPGVGQLRELVASAATISKRRGTRIGLITLLEAATGLRGFDVIENVIDSVGQPRPFHVRIIAPLLAEAHRSLLERIIDQEKPAHVTAELVFRPVR
jgi:phage tail-like protein